MSLVAFAGGFFGGQNKIYAEERAAQQAAAAKAAENLKAQQADGLKYFQGLLNSEKGLEQIRTQGWWDVNKDAIFKVGGQQLTDTYALMIDKIEEEDGYQMYGEDNVFKFMMPDKADGNYDKNWLENLDTYLGTKDGFAALAKLRETPEHYKSLVNAIAAKGGRYIRETHSKMNKNGSSSNHQILLNNEFRNLTRWKDLNDSLREITGFDAILYNESLNNKLYVPKDSEKKVYHLSAKVTNQPSLGVTFSPNEDQKNILLKTATNMNMSVQQVLNEWGLHSESSLRNIKDPNNPAEVNAAYKPLFKALELGVWSPSKLDPSSGLLATVTLEDKYNMGEILFGESGNDIHNFEDTDYVGMTKSLVFHMIHNPEKILETNYGPNVATVTRQDALGYATKRIFGKGSDKVSKEQGLDYINKGVTNSDATAKKLRELYNKIDAVQLTGKAANFYSFWDGLFGMRSMETDNAGGFINQIASQLGISQAEGATWKADIASRLESQDGGIRGNLGRIEALRTVLAFQMARAFDPSGRLSNMDIEIQLARLGGSDKFTSVDSALAAVKLAMEDIEEKQKYYKLLQQAVKPTEGQTWLTRSSQAQVDAALAVKDIIDGHAEYMYNNNLINTNTGFTELGKRKYLWQLKKPVKRGIVNLPPNQGTTGSASNQNTSAQMQQNQNAASQAQQSQSTATNSPVWTLPQNNKIARIAGDTDTIFSKPGLPDKFDLRPNGIIRYNYLDNRGVRSFVDIDPNINPFTIDNNIITWG